MEHRFYAIQTTAGHENKVRSLIQRKIEADPRRPRWVTTVWGVGYRFEP